MIVLNTVALLSGLAFLALLRHCLKFKRTRNSFKGVPGYGLLLSLDGIVHLLPKIPLVSLGAGYYWVRKYQQYQLLGWDAFCVTSFWPITTWFITSDPYVIKDILASRSKYDKAVDIYAMLGYYGDNLGVTLGSEWSKHKKITSPAFSEKNLRLVWRESVKLVDEMFEAWGPTNGVVRLDDITKVTTRYALLVIAGAGFGNHTSWLDGARNPNHSSHQSADHEMNFFEAMHGVANELWMKLFIPGPLWGTVEERKTLRVGGLAGKGYLGKRVQKAAVAFSELRKYMIEMIEAKRTYGKNEDHSDLFTNLLRASEAEKGPGEGVLTEEEILGNIYVFLLAGHETSAHTLAFAFGLLALHQDEQEKAYQAIRAALPDGRQPLYEDIPTLNYLQAVLYESIRIYPPATGIVKKSTEDSIFYVRSCSTSPLTEACDMDALRTIIVPKNTHMSIDIAGLHNNPRYWPDPWEFKPERFLGDWNRDAFLGFSAGARSCMGRKFAETESIAFLTQTLLRYKVLVDFNDATFPEIPGESPQATRARLLANQPALTICPVRVPLKLVRRL